jgi:transposase-like protein
MGSMERAAASSDNHAGIVKCPWCGSVNTERVGEFGPQLMSAQHLCLDCRSPFERIRERGAGKDD